MTKRKHSEVDSDDEHHRGNDNMTQLILQCIDHKKKYKLSSGVDESTGQAVKKHKKKKHKKIKYIDESVTEENSPAIDVTYSDNSMPNSKIKEAKKKKINVKDGEENNEYEINIDDSGLPHQPAKKHQKNKKKHNTEVDEHSFMEKETENNNQVEQSENNSKKKHKNSLEEETTKANKVKYTPEYFGDKPSKSKKKKKQKVIDVKKEAEGPSKKDSALEYLKLWNTDRQKWKFQKLRQMWLLQHMYQVNEVPDDSFDILLLYLDGLKGRARETTIAEAEKCLQSLEDEDENSDSVKDPLKYSRARQLLQALS